MNRHHNQQGTFSVARLRCTRGFTIIELLTVMAVMSLLTALLWPVVQQGGRHTKTIACQGQLRQWGMGFAQFTEEHENALLNAPIAVWDPFWQPYCDRHKDLFVCPMATRYEEDAGGDRLREYCAAGGCVLGDKFKAWKLATRTPATLEPGPLVGSYGINYGGLSLLDPRVNGGRKINRSNIPVFLDCVDFSAQAKTRDGPPLYDGHRTSPGDMKRPCINRHGGGINSLFLDWSVRKVGLKELWTLEWSRWFDPHGPWTRAGGVQPENWPAWMRTFRDY
ncbi:MAG: prepilin-type N-terminal cleavage/methylation domain-containing protein [Planctomycetes bacterium]|nr:prepilin-type N-terminal cleavage/methylation domain-containing protein [Planctomycetota bacterium]